GLRSLGEAQRRPTNRVINRAGPCCGLVPEVFPAPRAEFSQATVRAPDENFLTASDAADFSNWDSANARRNAFMCRGRKQKFVVLSAMERKGKANASPRAAVPGDRNGFLVDFRPHARFFANVHQVRREPVADIDHRRALYGP